MHIAACSGIPRDAKTRALVRLFGAFGETHYCRILRDHETEASKGRGFVRFVDRAAADKCLEKAQADEV